MGTSKILGTIANRRVLLDGTEIILPDGPVGKAFRFILTGQQQAGSPRPVNIADVCNWDLVEDLRDLLSALLDIESGDDSETVTSLKAAGVKDPTLSELAADPWLTPERVERAWKEINNNSAEYGRINNRVGMLIVMLRGHCELPDQEEQERDGWSYVSGKYANEIEY